MDKGRIEIKDTFMPAALKAAGAALNALAEGRAYDRDDLVAGRIALEEFADKDERAELIMAPLRAVMLGLYILATRADLAASDAGRKAAVQFASTVRHVQRTMIH